MRAALMALNLTMGDTVRFSCRVDDDDDHRVCGRVLAGAVRILSAPKNLLWGRESTETAPRHRKRGPRPATKTTKLSENELAANLFSRRWEMALFALIYVLFLVSALTYQHDDDRTRVYSDFSPYPATFALALMFLALSASFFSHVPSSAGSARRSHPPGSKGHFFIPSRHAVAAPHRLGRTARRRRDT